MKSSSNSAMEMVTLKNGAVVPKVAVMAAMMGLKGLLDGSLRMGPLGPICLIELVSKCRNPEHQLLGNISELLTSSGFLNLDGALHKITKNIVLSAVIVEGPKITLQDPINRAAMVEQSRNNVGSSQAR